MARIPSNEIVDFNRLDFPKVRHPASEHPTFVDATDEEKKQFTHAESLNHLFNTIKRLQLAFNDLFDQVNPAQVNRPPNANFSFGANDLTVSFNSTSNDPDNDTLTHAWSFGDGSTSTQRNPAHSYANAGTYSVSLTVTDPDGLSDTETKSVSVQVAANLERIGIKSFPTTQANETPGQSNDLQGFQNSTQSTGTVTLTNTNADFDRVLFKVDKTKSIVDLRIQGAPDNEMDGNGIQNVIIDDAKVYYTAPLAGGTYNWVIVTN